LKIGIVTYALYIGGVEVAIKTLYDYFSKNGYSVDIIQTLAVGSETKTFQNNGYSVKSILIRSFESQNNYAQRLANVLDDYDILLLNNVKFVHYLLGLLNEKKIILPILHNTSDESYEMLLINQNQYNKVICVSHTLEQIIKLKNQIPMDKVVTIPTGVDVPQSFPKKVMGVKKTFRILFVGRIEESSKGVLLLPKIINRVVSNSNKEIELLIIGDGPSRVILEKEIKRYNLQNYIKLLGAKEHNEVIEQLREADILLMPSYHEGQGLVYLEAMAQGLIPLVSNLENNTNLVIKDYKNGFLCPIEDVECFASKILYLLENKEQIMPLSKEAWFFAKSKLSSQIMAKRYYDLILELKDTTIKRTKNLDNIPYGNLPYFLYIGINFIFRVKNKIRRVIENGTKK